MMMKNGRDKTPPVEEKKRPTLPESPSGKKVSPTMLSGREDGNNPTKIIVELGFGEAEFRDELVSRIAHKLSQRHLEKAMTNVCNNKLRLSPEAVENVIQKAFEKATKDIAKWKLIRDFIDLDIKVKRILKTLEKRGIELAFLTVQEAERRDLWDKQR